MHFAKKDRGKGFSQDISYLYVGQASAGASHVSKGGETGRAEIS